MLQSSQACGTRRQQIGISKCKTAESGSGQGYLTTKRQGNVIAKAISSIHTDPDKRIVVTGIGCCSCFGNDPDVFYDKLLAGESGVKQISKFDVEGLPTQFAAQITDFDNEGLIKKKDDRRLDDCLRYTLVAGQKAVKDAGLCKDDNADEYNKLDKVRCGVIVGSGMGGLTVFQDGVKAMTNQGYRKMSPFFIPYAITNMGSAMLAMGYEFQGPNYSISTACATANYAYVAAANHIRQGEADMIITGGSEAAIIPVGLGGFIACRALSTRNEEPEKASRPWDQDRDGFVMGEGAGVLVFESLSHARKRGAKIYGEYLDGYTTCDAFHMTNPRPDGSGVARCVKEAISRSGIDINAINHINAHATSTYAGDIAEVKALKSIFPEHAWDHIKMNATKSLIGHSLGAAAGLESIAILKAIERGEVHPTINQDKLIEEVEGINTVPNVKQKLKVTGGLSNSFGFGGHNSAVVFAPFEE